MITSIDIENVRGIETGRIEGLTPLTILTGPNACGKSTVLDGLLVATSPTPEEALGRAAKWYAEFGADDFFRAVWRDEQVAEQLRERLEKTGAWQTVARLAGD